MQKLLLLLVCFFVVLPLQAQDDVPLTAVEVELTVQPDAFGGESQVVVGQIRNNSASAYADISVSIEAFDAAGEVIGEGFGFLANACRDPLIDFVLQPGRAYAFSAPFEQFEDGEIVNLQVSASGSAVEPEVPNLLLTFSGLTTISGREVVAVEWLDAARLRYGVGCAGSVFTELEWFEYDTVSGANTPITHPAAALVTASFLQQTGITRRTQSGDEDPLLYNRSFLTFPPNLRRALYQTDLHTIVSAEADGSFKRLIHEKLHQHSLQGFIWLPEGRFLAYYYGAYGEPVRYFTANLEGQMLSGLLEAQTPSVTIPGPTDDGRFAVIGGAFDGVTGYFLKSTQYVDNALLFEAELPGNNYPAPVYYRKDEGTRYVYVMRPVAGQPSLQCFHREANTLETLTALPLRIDTDERAWSFVSPDYRYIALAANGTHGGLWLIDLNSFSICR